MWDLLKFLSSLPLLYSLHKVDSIPCKQNACETTSVKIPVWAPFLLKNGGTSGGGSARLQDELSYLLLNFSADSQGNWGNLHPSYVSFSDS